MDNSPSQTTPSSLLSFPQEIRLAIYKIYFAQYVGQIKVWSDKDLTRLETADPGTCMYGLRGRVHVCRFHSTLPPARSQGPRDLLLASRSVYIEAMQAFVKSTCFRFSDVQAIRIFALDTHESYCDDIRSIVLEYSHSRQPHQVRRMLCAASRYFPKLEKVTVDVSRTLSEKGREELEDEIFLSFEDHSIEASKIWILDFARERRFDEFVEGAAPLVPLPKAQAKNVLASRRWLTSELDEATDRVRERLLASRARKDEKASEPLAETREGLAMKFFSMERAYILDVPLRHHGIVRTSVL